MNTKRIVSLLAAAAIVPAGLVATAFTAGANEPGAAPAVESAPAPDPAPATARCDEGHWPLSVQGEPRKFEVGGPAGYYVWHDRGGWHLRTTSPWRVGHTFTGRITSSDDIEVLRIHKNEDADQVRLEGEQISFSFDTHKHVDGVDFKVGCTESVTFELQAEGYDVPAPRIRLGLTGSAPSNPFTVTRLP